MMNIFRPKDANCKNCYKCIRHCPVKAIAFRNEQARVMEDACIYCGRCTAVCPQHAKEVLSNLDEVQRMIEAGESVVASVSPAFVADFPGMGWPEMKAVLLQLGFSSVYEMADGAEQVAEAYQSLIAEGRMDNIITTACPAIVQYVERYIPEMIPQLAPILSPAAAHARMIRKQCGKNTKVCFIGPCIAEKHQAAESRDVDDVLLFQELRIWMHQQGLHAHPELIYEEDVGSHPGRLFALPGGIIDNLKPIGFGRYQPVAIDGLERCIRTLKDLQQKKLTGFFLELSSCTDACVGGASPHHHPTPFLTSVASLKHQQVRLTASTAAAPEIDISCDFQSKKVEEMMPTMDELIDILAAMGKTNPADLLNCGSCGYNTCHEKAIAVFQGKSNPMMCLPHMRQKAESTANAIIENTPNGLLKLDRHFCIQEVNQAAIRLLALDDKVIGRPIEDYLQMNELSRIREDGNKVMNIRKHTLQGHAVVEQSIVPMPNKEYLVILKDMSVEDEHEQALMKVRRETLETAQAVIDKQMRVAQEIASLLGETTGETKAALLKLKASVHTGGDL